MDNFLGLLRDACQRRDFKQAAELLWIPIGELPISQYATDIRGLPAPQSFNTTAVIFPPPLVEAGLEHLKCLMALLTSSAPSSPIPFKHELEALQYLTRQPMSRAELPILRRLAWNVYHLARASEATGPADSAIAREEAARVLAKAFTFCMTDRSPLSSSRRWAAIFVAGLLFRLYFGLGTVRLAGNILRAIDTTISGGEEFPSLIQLPKADAIIYCYYRARMALNQGNFAAAEEFIVQGLGLCINRFPGQKR